MRLPSHHAARPQSRYRAKVLFGCAGPEGSPPHRTMTKPSSRWCSVCARGRGPAQESAKNPWRAAGRAHYNWDEEKYGEDRHFGHLAYEGVDDIYATCDR